ncbi:hypothetical protein CAI21_14740 [Alkalilimnicola ehrlichii]|uniref:Uncharacterized protein n=1 Tax=Alkalilimnicola ehrlichii TaxID=351052 RepID=A0A3E0WQZ8_9GAMM|nr:hypothetical protein CAI21_14740 [Alkalilimnicola ehrlichii]RFA34405.1 hypothetical protein CAL65_15310 [Alkalilimnicola ehrlichii]
MTAEGEIRRLVVATEEDMQAQWEIATDQNCPSELAEQLQQRKVVPAFPSEDGFYRPEFGQWQRYLHPAEAIAGHRRYYLGLSAPIRNSMVRLASYAEYLDWLDAAAHAD